MNFQFLLSFGLLFQTISSSEPVSKLLDLLDLTGYCGWEQRVQKCYDGCVKVFKRYPNEIFDIGDNLIDSFKSYIDASKMWNNSNSTVMASRSTDLLETISLLANLGGSPSYSLYVHRKANPKLFVAYRAVVSYLEEYLNQLTVPIRDSLTDLENSFDDLFDQFSQLCLVQCDKFDFRRIMKSGQRLANIINLVVDVALNHTRCETLSNDTYEAIAVLVCILFDNFLNIQGAIISKAALLKSYLCDISDFHYSCLLSLDPFISGIAASMNTMNSDIAKGVRELSVSLVDNICKFNSALNALLGPSEGVAINEDHVVENLLKSGQ